METRESHSAILSATILLKLVDSYLIAFKFTQLPGMNTKESVRQIASCKPSFIRYDLSATFLLKLVDSYLIALKFTQLPGMNTQVS